MGKVKELYLQEGMGYYPVPIFEESPQTEIDKIYEADVLYRNELLNTKSYE